MSTPVPPTASFIMPAYNAQATITQALASVAAQTVADWEAVIVDDGSTDGTAAVLQRLAAADPRLRVIRQRNAGASAARNRGLAEARGQFLTFLDADDWIDPDFLQTLIPLADGGRAIAYCAYRRILPSGRQTPPDWCPELQEDAFQVLVKRCEPAIHCLLLPRQMVVDAGGFDPDLRTCEDWDLWLRLARTGVPFAGTPRALAHYRMRAFSLSTERGGAGDAARVMALALGPDARVAHPAPRYASGWQDAPENRLAQALETQVARLVRGLPTQQGWIEDALGAGWQDVVADNPDQTMASIGRAVAAAPPDARGFILDRLLQGLRQADDWTGRLLADWADIAAVRENCTPASAQARRAQAGRWLAIPGTPSRLPRRIVPPPGCDALLLVCRVAGLPQREMALPFTTPLTRAALAGAVLESWNIGELMRMLRPVQWPRFAAAAAREALHVLRLGGAGLADRSHARAMGKAALRRAVARTIGARVPGWPVRHPVGEVPILMFDRIVPGTARLSTRDIGAAQVADLLHLLADEGHHAISLADLNAAREGRFMLPDRPIILVFGHATSAQDNRVFAAMPPALAVAEVLFTPDEIGRGLPARLMAQTLPAGLHCGLRVRRMPLDTAQALAATAGWRAQLAQVQPATPVCAAFSDEQGLPDAVLRASGFAPILSPGTAHARVDNATAIVPAIECCGSEAIGDVIENLRQAA
ncbi:MAG: hypothetical protein RLZZ08_139 [Pseudomonadota bacterium]|jgi:hypothetical protein